MIFGSGGAYVPVLGGNMTILREDLYSAHEFLNGESFFATYATVQEVMEGTFQPTGIDYIIHVLGDGQRQKYLDAFKSGSFKYAVTIRDDYTDWGHTGSNVQTGISIERYIRTGAQYLQIVMKHTGKEIVVVNRTIYKMVSLSK